MSIGYKSAYAMPSQHVMHQPHEGLSFRERLIVAAVQGLCANPSVIRVDQEYCEDYRFGLVPWLAMKIADEQVAMLDKEDGK